METNIQTNVGRLPLRSPLILGACPLTASSQVRLAAEVNGIGAIVLPSLFEEQVLAWEKRGCNRNLPTFCSLSYNAVHKPNNDGPAWHNVETYLSFVNEASTLSSVPIIANLNGSYITRWSGIARELEECGATAIEINLDLGPLSNYSSSSEIEDKWCEVATSLSQCVKIPILLKLSRQVTSAGHLARKVLSGVEGIVLYGRRPDYDISLDSFELRCDWSLTNPSSVPRVLTHLLEVHEICPLMSLVASGGFSTAEHVIKALVMGADAVMVVSPVYRAGVGIVRTIMDGLVAYMQEKRIATLTDLRELRPTPLSPGRIRDEIVFSLTKEVASKKDVLPRQIGDRWGHPMVKFE